ncbi:transmembrane adaptor Erv26 [Chloropicon primus]|uniref:Transmembrane adaptor Erv26 n=1 Tax=Chloropicon primus TaxID=1764295 RepID=A0A5B8MQN2_9CHLO|nr:transmembrane adaptor Erv26 [Chloropicon primus]|eukprot:QDZ21925.1 transmembrane adaptor Erv26 [Chloropicon primus]
MDWRLSTLLVYVSAYMLVAALAVCLATGVYYVAEVIEENTKKTKTVLRYLILSTMGAHVILLVWDRQPLVCVLSGLMAQGAYLQLLTKKFPYISFTSPVALIAVAALVVNQVAWYYHFTDTRETMEYIVCFCLAVVWLVPIILMLSVASQDGVLPGVPGASVSTNPAAQGQEALYGGPKRGFLLQIFYLLQAHTTPYLKMVASALGIKLGKSTSRRDHRM